MANNQNTLSYAEVNEVVKTLPTGIYLGTRIEFTLDENCPASYYDAMKFMIVISYPMIAKIATADCLEEDARCLLYHEISHAMLTPKSLYDYICDMYWGVRRSKVRTKMEKDLSILNDIKAKKFGKDVTDVKDLLEKMMTPLYSNGNLMRDLANIFEDQRIETLNRGVFLKVDFASFIKKINGYKPGEPIQDFLQFFYHVVRYNDIEKDLVKMLYDIIYKTSYVNANCRDLYELSGLFFDFLMACYSRYNEQQAAQQPSQQSQQQQDKQDGQNGNGQGQNPGKKSGDKSEEDNLDAQDGNGSDGSDSDEADNNDLDESDTTNDKNADSDANGNTKSSNDQQQSDHGAGAPTESDNLSKEDIEDIIKQSLKDAGYNDEDIEEAIEKLGEEVKKSCLEKVINLYNATPKFTSQAEGYILRMLRKRSTQAKTLNGYSGRINPKNVHRPGRVEDFRWFDKANPNGLHARGTKFRINFFCDNSGSFSSNQQVANSIIRSLWVLSKKYRDFEFTLVTHGDCHNVRTDNNMALECNEGTALFPTLPGIFHSLQKQGQQVWNFVLFDGGVCMGTEFYAVWNHTNVIMICDYDDKDTIEQLCPNAKKVFTGHYCEKLEENMLSCMDQMFR